MGPLLYRRGNVRKPNVKMVHLKLLIDLTTEAFVACLKRFTDNFRTSAWITAGLAMSSSKRTIYSKLTPLKKLSTIAMGPVGTSSHAGHLNLGASRSPLCCAFNEEDQWRTATIMMS